MKKTYIQYTEDGHAVLSRFDGSEHFALYFGIPALYGGWLLENCGEPTTLSSLEDLPEGCDYEKIDEIHSILYDPETTWEHCNEEDEEYIFDTLRAWGLM